RDLVFSKQPGEPETPWHQDRHWEPIGTDRFVGIWIALGEVTGEMGPIRFATGSHREANLALPDHEGRSQEAATRLIGERWPIVSQAPLAAGDATAHLGWTLHGSSANRSPRRRDALAAFYFADGARIETEPRDADPIRLRVHRHHRALRFPGLSPGAV